MNKEEIKHVKAMLKQGLLRHRYILLNEEFQKELLNIIKDYEKLQQENNRLKEQRQELRSWLENKLASDNYTDGAYYGFKSCLLKLNKLEGNND